MDKHQIDAQPLGREEGRERSRGSIEKWRGFTFLLGIEQILSILGADRV